MNKKLKRFIKNALIGIGLAFITAIIGVIYPPVGKLIIITSPYRLLGLI